MRSFSTYEPSPLRSESRPTQPPPLPRRWRCLLVFITVVATLAFAATALAQDPGAQRGRVIQLPDEFITGRPQAPGASFILTRSNDGYEVRELRTSFVPRVIRSVERGPF